MTHAYTVEMRFYGDQLEPPEISARLNLQPSSMLSKAQSQLATRKRRPYWAYNGHGEDGFQSEWTNLEDGLKFLLKVLSSRKADISSGDDAPQPDQAVRPDDPRGGDGQHGVRRRAPLPYLP